MKKKSREKKSQPIQKSSEKEICAYELDSPPGMALECAPLNRTWMDQTDKRFAYRCLPLVMGNTAGWMIKNPIRFSVWWKGGPRLEDLVIDFPSGQEDDRFASHFGGGVLTFKLPYLFKTPKGINLWVKGPTNWPKDGIQALEGIVETDWASSTFTMNWIMTRPNHLVWFEEGEPICMIIPIKRGLSEELTPVQRPLSANPSFEAEFDIWQKKREKFLDMLDNHVPEAVRQGWERDYFKGVKPGGSAVSGHQTRISLKEFQKVATHTPKEET